jgi:AmmeMemoRadiSam system protein B
MKRQAAVAGSFYAGTRDRLAAQLGELLVPGGVPTPAIAVVVPHAGYMYSGRVAGAVFSRVEVPDTCVVLGPNHTGLGPGVSVMAEGEWQTPCGPVPIDSLLAAAILERSDVLERDHLAHLREHSLEVQLPFLQHRNPAVRFVPITLLRHEYAVCAEVGRAVADAVRAAGRPVLLVASTDMSHYVSRETAAAKDRQALEAILALDPERLHRVVCRERISMCGFHPTTAVLVAAKALGATSAELVQYTDSGEVTQDTRQVVAYAGLIIR